LCPFLIETLMTLPFQDSSYDQVKFREAIYSSIGLCSHDLFDYLQFDDWMAENLVAQSQIQNDG
jgi:hypothetical protein